MERIASLLPSCTEIACALGLAPRLVARSHECDFPPEVAALPALTQPRLDPGASSRALDAAVKRLVSDGLSVYRVDADRLRELAPTLILTQDQCEVCAATPRDLEKALARWVGAQPRVLSLSPRRLDDVWRDVERVAESAGVAERGRELSARLAARADEIARRSEGLRVRPRVVCLEWIDPPMAAGNWMPELVERAGGRSVLAEGGANSPWIDLGALAAADPDAVVVLPCGFDLARTRAEMTALSDRPEWRALRAVRDGRAYLADGNQYFNRPGPRLVESLEILAEILHPDAFPRRHASAWERLDS